MHWSEGEYAIYLRQKGHATGSESERHFMDRIRSLAQAHGYRCYHTHDARRSEPGFPDLILCDGVSCLAVETKTNTGKLTPEQQIWLSLLEHAGVETHIWRPKDWLLIETRLTRRKPYANET